jgi:hypothetical protein
MSSRQCEYWSETDLRCKFMAHYQIEAQWTLVDYGYWYACDEHVQGVAKSIRERTCDGQPCVYLEVTAFD